MMKKILVVLLMGIMICSLFVGCGDSGTPAEVDPVDQYEEEEYYDEAEGEAEGEADVSEGSSATTDEYLDAMGTFIPGFEQYVQHMYNLLDQSKNISTDEEFAAWATEFMTIKANIGTAADELAKVTQHVPEEYQESHVKITIAVAAVYDAMTGFEAAVDGVVNGDVDTFLNGIVEFEGNMTGAATLWEEAVEYAQ